MAPSLRPCPDNCGQLVLRARTEAMKWQALNPEPDPEGNVAARVDHRDNVFARTLRKNEAPAPFERVYMPHKATCAVERAQRDQRARQPQASVTDLGAWRAAASRHNATLRRKRGKRPGPPVTGIRYNPRGRTR